MSPSGLHFPRALIHSQLPACQRLGLPPPPRPPAAHPRGRLHRRRQTLSATPSRQRLPQPSPPRAGARQLPGKRRQNSHGATARSSSSFFFKGSDVTVWWQESYPVSFPSSHNNPAPENLPLRAQNISWHHVKMRAKPPGAGLTQCARNESR